MNVVGRWTGARAMALRLALRMTIEDFAHHLGISVRAAATWNLEPDREPTLEVQRALDTVLSKASEEEQARFELLVPHGPDLLNGAEPILAPDVAPEPVGVTTEVVETRMGIDIAVDADGWATLSYTHELRNTGDVPYSRLVRELWFETTEGPLKLAVRADPVEGDRRVMIQRIHDTPSMAKFACQLLPALQPGETATVAYTCSGGRFVYDHYWRQSIARPTDELAIHLRHAGVDSLTRCSASEERPDGAEISAADGLSWRRDDDGVTISLVRQHLDVNQTVTLRWGTARAA